MYQNNKFEKEAKVYVEGHIDGYRDCLKNGPPPILP